MAAGPSTPQLLTLSPLTDRQSNPIILLHTAALPSIHDPPEFAADQIRRTISMLPPTAPFVVVLCHGAIATAESTTLAGVRAFRAAYEDEAIVPAHVRARISSIIALHMSVFTRSHIYMASFSMQHGEYAKLHYCDLLADLEDHLGIDSTMLGLKKVDFDYDEQMRYWVGRQHEHIQFNHPNPSKPIIDLQNVSLSDDSLASQNNDNLHMAQP